MANCNDSFLNYNKEIRLTDDKRSELIVVRDNLRTRVKHGYDLVSPLLRIENKIVFQSQGSFVMDTIIKPIHDDYDIDDGIYFLGSLDKETRPSPEKFHELIIKAVDRGHIDIEKIEDKSTCVRVLYKKGFHVDLPIYYADNYDSPDLAEKDKGWILSNPIEFIAWFEEKINSGFQKSFIYESKFLSDYQKWSDDIRKKDVQLRRIVRYLKSWGDLRREEMPCGLIMTILAANNYFPNDRDDIALKETLIKIKSELRKTFRCERPTTPEGEDLLSNYENKDAFLRYIDIFIDNAKNGLVEQDPQKACEHWQKSLGTRFKCNYSKNAVQTKSSSGLATGAATSRPWVNLQ
jgi:hypothetical protein